MRKKKPTTQPTADEPVVDAKGYFVDPEHPTNKTTKEEWEAQREERKCRANWARIEWAAKADRPEAIAAGVRYAFEQGEAPPKWLADAVERLAHLAMQSTSNGRGAPADPQLHLERWSSIVHLMREHGRTLEQAVAAVAEHDEEHSDKRERLIQNLKKSYQKVERWRRAGLFDRYTPFRPPN